MDEVEVDSEAREKSESPCSMLPMIFLRLCQIMLQNANGAGQRQATAAGSSHLFFTKGYSDSANRCRQRELLKDSNSLVSDNLPGVLLLSIAATSATSDLVARHPVCTLTFGRALQLWTNANSTDICFLVVLTAAVALFTGFWEQNCQ